MSKESRSICPPSKTDCDGCLDFGPCRSQKAEEPCGMVVFGASGDLAARKLLPALYNLYVKDLLPDAFFILGCGRKDLGRAGFREHLRGAFDAAGVDLVKFDAFADRVYYRTIAY
ncbi:MAG: hypothetical protein GY868_18255, partial [Deltaproteobacteria bacterium]|nr:hypothetical protein [Deltaproteobacteria bacterium]